MQKFHSESRLLTNTLISLKTSIFLLSIFFLSFSLVCPAAVINVPVNYPTIQEAIDAASDGDEIIVSPGTYNENINFNGNNIILRSTDPTSPTVVENTIINGIYHTVVMFSGREAAACVLSGFTITNGDDSGIYGKGTEATIEYNKITSNHGSGRSYAHFESREVAIHDTTHPTNTDAKPNSSPWPTPTPGPSTYGGGIRNCSGIIQNNIISNNSATYGGGLYMCNGIIQNNTISDNSALDGSGLYGCYGSIINNTISYNWNSALCTCDATIQNNIISENYGSGLSDCQGMIQNNFISDNSGSGLYECHGNIISNIISNNTFGGLVSCDAVIMSNIISGNSGDYGGGLEDCEGLIINNTICSNSASAQGGGFYNCEGIIANCIIWGNSAPEYNNIYDTSPPYYSCIQDWNGGGRGNISSDPRFVDPLNGNYHLQPDSPCIDAGGTYYLLGDYIADIDGECRLAGATVDMGADEYGSSLDSDGDLLADTDEATPGCNPSNSDTDGDGLKDGVEIIRGTSPIIADSSPGISIPDFCSSIQEGIFLAFPLEEITVSPGTYAENLFIFRNNLTLQSMDPHDDDIVSSTVIDGEGIFSVIAIKDTVYEGCTIKGFTIRNGSTDNGGGIRGCGYGAAATIENNKIVNNTAAWDGGGLYRLYGIIQNNIISGNSAHSRGGGLASCSAMIQNNIISDNRVTGTYGDGGGLYNCYGTIQYNTIWGNSATYGGGIYGCNYFIKNCIVWGNTNAYPGQIRNSSTPSYCCIQDWSGGGTGNISSDPRFVDPGNGDFHLQPDSPCIDTGCYDPYLTEDFEGDARPWRSTVEFRGDGSGSDIGADEFSSPFSYDFVESQERWTTGTAAVFSPPQWTFEQGSLIMMSQNNTSTFGFWQTTEYALPVYLPERFYAVSTPEGYIYRARFTVSTNVPIPSLVPQIRLRVNSKHFRQADYLVIDSNGEGGASPTTAGTSYDLYFASPINDRYSMLAFDLLNFNPSDASNGEVALESVVVESFDLQTLGDPISTWTYDFETSQEGWATGYRQVVFTDPEYLWADGALHLRSTTNTNTFGYWQNDPLDIIVEADRLYRGTFEVRTDTYRYCAPQMRLRFNTTNMQACRALEISSIGDGTSSPRTTNTTYDRLYFLPPANCIGEGLIVSFDMLNFSPDDATTASLILDRAIIETIELPPLP